MKIKIYGFTWDTDPPERVLAFLNYVHSENVVQIQSLNHMWKTGAVFDLNDYHRVVVATPLADDLWSGFVLTVKNARKFVETTQTARGFRVSARQLSTATRKFAEIN